jgi:hypothetical protein
VEGLCELFAYLWLKSIANPCSLEEAAAAAHANSSSSSSSSSAEHKKDVSSAVPVSVVEVEDAAAAEDALLFLDLQKSNEDPVYGGGFRAALKAFEAPGVGRRLPLLLHLVKEHRALPR